MEKEISNNGKMVNILWTGGWDSTYRVIKLAHNDVVIQPYYLIDDYRKSVEIEIETIKKLTSELRNADFTKCRLNDVIIKKITEIEEDSEITEAYNTLLNKKFFGGQYDWLARFAKQLNGLELTIHQDDKAFEIIKQFGSLKKINDSPKGEYFILDNSKSSAELIKVFGSFNFPILEYSKLDMKRDAEENRFINLMNKTWFCHTPIDNEACGICNPCIYTIEEGLKYRFSAKALRRYNIRKYLAPLKKSFIYKLYKKLR